MTALLIAGPEYLNRASGKPTSGLVVNEVTPRDLPGAPGRDEVDRTRGSGVGNLEVCFAT